MSTLTAAELARRVRAHSRHHLGQRQALTFLLDWERQGVAEQVLPGRWRLTASGLAMFSAYASNLDLIDNWKPEAA